ncbi:MAG: hypothetical protein R3244_00040 [Thermoanaerobaculia bacterium]|nr:hypothetical protein [Thermoanaerobaculia bacterium]
MRRSFSTSLARLTALGRFVPAACTLALLASPLPAAETLAESLAAELELARGSEIYLLIDTEGARLEVRSRGLVLDRVDIRRLGVKAWGPLLGARHDTDVELPTRSTITRGAPQRREIVVGGEAANGAGNGDDTPPAMTTPAVVGSYACVLDNGWLLQVRDHGEGDGLWGRLWEELSDPFDSRPASRDSHPTLVIELDTADTERLRHLFRRDRALLIR